MDCGKVNLTLGPSSASFVIVPVLLPARSTVLSPGLYRPALHTQSIFPTLPAADCNTTTASCNYHILMQKTPGTIIFTTQTTRTHISSGHKARWLSGKYNCHHSNTHSFLLCFHLPACLKTDMRCMMSVQKQADTSLQGIKYMLKKGLEGSFQVCMAHKLLHMQSRRGSSPRQLHIDDYTAKTVQKMSVVCPVK
jgi:hypothetical protein